MAEKNKFEEVIKALEEERKAIDIALAKVRAMSLQNVSPGSSSPETPTTKSGSKAELSQLEQDIRSDSFFGLSITAAAKKYLLIVKSPKETRVIGEALKKGGILSTSENFFATVHSGLSRDKAFVRLKKQWWLAEWYPALKPKATNGEEKPKTKRKGGRPKKVKVEQPIT